MAEVMGVMLRRNPKQVFNIFIKWNLTALWRRIKKLQRPWAPYNPPKKRKFPQDTETKIPRQTEPYLRSTADVDPYAPEIVALALTLGLKEKSKREYVEDAYHWVKNNIVFFMEVPPDGVINVLNSGYGLCLSKMSVFVALVRLAGIPARFLTYMQEMGGGFMDLMAREMLGDMGEELLQELKESNELNFTHGCVEVFLDEEWIPADLTWTEEEEAGMELPISQFGESPFGKWYNVLPDSTTISETLPISSVRFQIAVSIFLLRGLYDRTNEHFIQLRKKGRKILDEMGKEVYIKSKKKFYVPPPRLVLDE
jgi:transglutaminase-like putative cysteine protease